MFERYTERARRVLFFARYEASQLGSISIETEHLLLGILREERSVAATILMEKGMRLNTVREDIVALLNEKTTLTRVKETPLLAEFSRDLTESAMKNQLDPLVGREHELERVQQVLGFDGNAPELARFVPREEKHAPSSFRVAFEHPVVPM